MNVKIRTHGLKRSHNLNNHIRSRLYFVLSRYGRKIRGIEVALSNVNGSRAESEIKCLITIKLDHFQSIVVHYTAPDTYEAVDNCSKRAKRELEKHLNHIRKQQRSPYHRYA